MQLSWGTHLFEYWLRYALLRKVGVQLLFQKNGALFLR